LELGGYGNLVKLRHPDGSVTLYAHNSRLLVRRGETVQQGEPIAQMGSTGFSTDATSISRFTPPAGRS
jgi:murein DD-endopeptidase MepM/ murein hydrolase activator NlpD